MEKEELLRKVGSMQQAACIRPVRFMEGRAGEMKAFEVKNDRMSFLVLEDKCLDIGELSYKGCNMNFLSKPGLTGRAHYDTNGDEAIRSIMGGMLFTCGLRNICVPCTARGEDFPMHGRIRTTPAEHVCSDAWWEDRVYRMRVAGEMREAALFGENLVLRREITTAYKERAIHIRDVVSNEGFREEPFMILYHCNMGWPLLSEECELIIPSVRTVARDEDAMAGLPNWDTVEAPIDGEPEYVFLHEMASDESGNTFAAVYNRELGIGLQISFSKKVLPYFMEWKSRASGDYALGLEPANASVYGKQYHLKRGDHPSIAPQEEVVLELTFSVLDGEEDFKKIKKQKEALLERYQKPEKEK